MATRKPTSKARGRWSFSSTRELVAWMQDEYLSEIVLEILSPRPTSGECQPLSEVSFTWWLHGGGRRVPYRVVARDVRVWSFEGQLGDGAISIPPPEDDASSMRLVMEVPPGRLVLECESVAITRGRAERTLQKRPFIDYTYFSVSGADDLSPVQLLEVLGAPSGARVVTGGSAELLTLPAVGRVEVQVDHVDWVVVFRAVHRGEPGYWMSVSRASASDDDWHRAQALPRHVRCTRVGSAWEFDGTPSEWLELIDPP
jgi:hypothetical protein